MKKAMATTVASLLTLLSVAAIPAFALETGGVQIRGDVKQQANVRGDVTVAARGEGAKAGASLATVHGGTDIRGKVTQTASARNVTTVAQGKNAKACLEMASIGNNPACK